MTILSSPPADWKRPSMPDRVKLAAVQRKFGPLEFDHRPPLSERPFDTERNDTVPPANDPAHIDPVTRDDHDKLTNGPGGEKRVTSAGSDAHSRAKVRRLSKAQEEVRRKILARPCGQKRQTTGRWPKRGFPKREKGRRG